ncbi:MAG: sugar phosphate isomerase/epimerase [Acidobacteriota bacterium]|nr:sugar phosphate isomerase/epimerase [Acidobacteriota bacterium]
MPSSTRRTFVAQSAALLAASKLAFADKLRKNNLGVQLYTVRNIIASDPAKVLQEIREIGYAEIEATADTLKEAWSAIQNSGLKAISVHLNTNPTDDELADAKTKGFEYAVVPYIPPSMRGGVDVMKKLAASLQAAGKRAQSHGLQLCYHSHAFEYEPMDGTTPLQILMGETQPDAVKLELDIFWAAVAGHNPVDLLKTYSGRIPLLHLKDKEKGVPAKPQYNENVPKDAFKEIGNGSIDIPAVLTAANAAGVKHYFVEQDQTPDPIASLRQSYTYLSKHFGG